MQAYRPRPGYRASPAPPTLRFLPAASVPTYAAAAAAVFPGAPLERSGLLRPRVAVRGYVRGAPVEVIADVMQRRRGTVPTLEVRVLGPTGGASAYLRLHTSPDAAYESSVPVPGVEGDRRVAGAPRALLERLGAGSFAARTAWIDAAEHGELCELGVGPLDGRLGDDGVRLELHGWPADAETLMFVIDTALGVLDDAQVLARQAPGASLALHPEVVAYRRGRAGSAHLAKVIIALVLLATAILSVGFGAVMLGAMHRSTHAAHSTHR